MGHLQIHHQTKFEIFAFYTHQASQEIQLNGTANRQQERNKSLDVIFLVSDLLKNHLVQYPRSPDWILTETFGVLKVKPGYGKCHILVTLSVLVLAKSNS